MQISTMVVIREVSHVRNASLSCTFLSRDSRLLQRGCRCRSWGDDTHDTYDTSYGLPHATTHDACDARDDATSAHDAGAHATYQCPGCPGLP